jgi:predicted RNase H-like nuclease (RuvC/YqgF family)
MLVLNRGKRIIDGISPNEKKEISNELAERLLKMYSSEIIALESKVEVNDKLILEIENLKAENESLKAEVQELKKKQIIDEEDCNCDCNCDLDKLRQDYLNKIGKEVPKNMKNNQEWIQSKLLEV